MEASALRERVPLLGKRRLRDRFGDAFVYGLTALCALGSLAVMFLIAWRLVDDARLSMSEFGVSFLWETTWDPIKDVYGAGNFILGTLLSSFLALLVAAPVSIAIGLYLSELAPRGVRTVVGSLVEMLAAVPSVVLGLWGILVLGPVVQSTIGPALNAV